LFGEIDVPIRVANTSASGFVVPTRAFQSPSSYSIDADSGICRAPASVFGVLKVPS
jgi:hypothetical protein